MKRASLLLFVSFLLSACRQETATYSWAEARDYLETPQSMSRSIDYLSSDNRFHYFEHKLEMVRVTGR